MYRIATLRRLVTLPSDHRPRYATYAPSSVTFAATMLSMSRLTVWNILWRIWDNLFLLQMGSAYLERFQVFAQSAEEVELWRHSQQAEWDRLGTVLGLLATMNAAILAITPEPPHLAFALWLAAAGLSICGLFTVHYFPITSMPLSNEDILQTLDSDNHSHIIDIGVLAGAVSSPIIMTMWSSILFFVGIVDYVIQANLGGLQYRIIALIPITLGLLACVTTLVVGETIKKRIKKRTEAASLPTGFTKSNDHAEARSIAQ